MILSVIRHSAAFGDRTFTIRDHGPDPQLPWVVYERARQHTALAVGCSSLEVAFRVVADELEKEGQP